MMTSQDMEKKMIDIADEMKQDIIQKMSKLDVKQKNALKAYKISSSIIDQAIKIVGMKFSDVPYDEMYYGIRENRVFGKVGIKYFSDCKAWYEECMDAESKKIFLVYSHAVMMLRSAFLDKNKIELEKAESAGDIEAIFEIRMVLDTITELLGKWENLWESLKG